MSGPARVLRAASRLRGRNNEGFVAATMALVVVLVGGIDSRFWSLATVFNVLHDSFEPLVFSLGFLMVLLTGGIDVSFDAIGIFAGYTLSLSAGRPWLASHVLPAFVAAAAIGLGLGVVNAAATAILRLPVLIVTLGTRGIIAGVLLSAVGSTYVSVLPGALGAFPGRDLIRVQAGGGQSVGLHVLVIPLVLLCLGLAFFLRQTVLGRGIYAVGGDLEAARRVGFPVRWIQGFVLCLAGTFAGLAGMIHVSLIGYGNPFDLVGLELNVIAAVVLGGASIFGGRGSVVGTILGVLFVSLINYSLILLGIPSTWQQVAIGILLVLGILAQTVSRRRARSFLATGGASA
ncbi:MAG TPA: ABC transporter permease [bacterium]|nr:ABC transporter permease [bacterium]